MPNSGPEALARFYRGQSMSGTLRPGDRLQVAPARVAEVRLGDVVVYRVREGEERVHRVVARGPAGLIAQGDNNPIPDEELVTDENLVGRVICAERGGKVCRVRGGTWGLWRWRMLRLRRGLWAGLKAVGRAPYRLLRRSGLMARLWRPAVLTLSLAGEEGPLVKYVHRGRTVACWRPAQGRFECRKPYDLVISPPDRSKER